MNAINYKRKIPNIITLFRIILSFVLIFHVIKSFGRCTIPVIIEALILLTDFLDGRIARHLGYTSRFGAVLDVFTDLFCICLLYIVLYEFHILPLWFLFIILLKFVEFTATSYLMNKYTYTKSIFVFDCIGRFTAGVFYIIPIAAYAAFNLYKDIYLFLINKFIIIVAFAALVSSAYRILCCIRADKFLKINI